MASGLATACEGQAAASPSGAAGSLWLLSRCRQRKRQGHPRLPSVQGEGQAQSRWGHAASACQGCGWRGPVLGAGAGVGRGKANLPHCLDKSLHPGPQPHRPRPHWLDTG